MHLLFTALLTIGATVCSTDSWDDSYSAEIHQIAQGDYRTADVLAADLRNLLSVWHKDADHASVRTSVARIEGRIRGQVRVEIGTVAGTQYRVVWIVSTADGTTLVSNLKGSLRSIVLPSETWKSLQAGIIGNHAWALPSAADYAVNDGTLFCVSVCVPEGTGQYVIYAPTLGPPTGGSEREDFARRTVLQDRLLTQIMQVADAVTR